MGIERYTVEKAKKLPSRSDMKRLKNMTDEDIERAAEDDPDNLPLTDEELKGFQPGEPRGGGAYGPKVSANQVKGLMGRPENRHPKEPNFSR